jgi:hypothetical protein
MYTNSRLATLLLLVTLCASNLFTPGMASAKNFTDKNVKTPSVERRSAVKKAAVVSSTVKGKNAGRSFTDPPVITSATYDAGSGILVVTGTDFIANGGDDVDVSKLTLVGEGGAPRQLTSANVAIADALSFSVQLNGADIEAVNKILNKNGTQATNTFVYNLTAAAGFMKEAGSLAVEDLTNGVTVSNVAVPAITSATYDITTGILLVTGTGLLSSSGDDIDLSKLTLTGDGGDTRTLSTSGTGVEILSTMSFSVTLTGADLAAVNRMFNKNGTSSTSTTTYNLEAAEDWNKGADASTTTTVSPTNPVTVSNVAVPAITSATYDVSTGILVVTGTGFQQLNGATNDVVVAKLTLTGDGDVTRNLTTSGTAVEITSATSFSVTLAGADLAAVNSMFNKNGTTSTTPSTYNLAAAEDWNAGADASTTTIASPTNAVTVSNVAVPAITSATYDVSTGILVVTGTGFQQLNGATNDVVVAKLTLTGDGDVTRNLTTSGTAVEITSATSFSVTLAGADLAAVNSMFNKNGTTSTTPSTYNLAAAEDWNAGADATTTTIASPTNPVTVSNVAVPAITSATYDVATGILVVTGTGFQQLNGATNDVVVAKLTLTGDGNVTRNLTTSGTAVEITSATSFSVTLAGADLAAVNSMFNKNGTTSTTPSTYNLAAAEDWNAGADPTTTTIASPTNAVTVSNVAVPVITSATYDVSTGILVVTGTGFQQLNGATNDVVVAKLTLTGDGDVTRNLTTSGTAVEITSATSFSVTLAGADLAAVNSMFNKNGTTSTTPSTYNLAAAEDWNAGADATTTTIASPTNAVTVSNVAVPVITSATYDVSTGILVVTGTGFQQLNGATNDVVVNKLTLSGDGGETRNLSTSGTAVEITSATSFSVTLAGADLAEVNRIINKNGTISSDGTPYNLVAAEDWNAGADGGLTIVDASNAVTVSNVAVPVITSATYDRSTGILVVTGTGFQQLSTAANDIDVTKLTLTGDGGATRNLTTSGSAVDITSSTSFSVTLAGADLAAVNSMFNKNGTTSTTPTTYNLAAAEDWNAGADVGLTIADATNGVTVSNVPVPAITSATYDIATGILVVTGTGFQQLSGAANDVVVNKLTLTGDGDVTRNLSTSGTAVEITSATSFSVTLAGADLAAVNSMFNKNGTTSTTPSTYNLAAAEDWNAGADATTTTIASPTNAVTVSNVAVPVITSATYDVSTGILVVTGTGFQQLNGATNDVVVNKLTLKGDGGATRNLSTSGTAVEITSATSFSVTLAGADLAAVNLMFNKNGTSSTTPTTYNLAAAEDWNAGADATTTTTVDPTNGVTVSNVAVPTITSATYDVATGILVVTGTGFQQLNGATNDVVVNKLTLTGDGGATRNLTTSGTAVEITSATSFSVTLAGADLAAVNSMFNKNGTSSTTPTTYNLAAAEDWNAGADASTTTTVDPTNGVTVSNVAVPAITSATYDAGTGILVVTGTGFQQLNGATNDVVVNKLTLTGENGDTRNLTTSGTAVEITSATSFSVTLAGADLAAVKLMFNKNGTSSTSGTAYNLAAAEDWNAGADASTTTIVSPTTAITASNVAAPAITSATYDVSTGILVVTGTGFLSKAGATNDIVVASLTLTGDGGATRNLSTSGAGVEVTSATSFSVTLAGADLAAVNLMFNKNGTSSTTPTTYNLAAAEDWNAGADASTTTTADPTNGVTVSNVAVPVITSATYDVATGILVVTGTGFQQLNGATNDVVVNKLTLKGDGGATRNLTTSGTAVEITSATSFSVTLAGADLAAVNSMFNKNGTTSTTPTTYNLAAAEDWNAGADASTTTTVDPTNGVTVSNVAVPAITSATYDVATGILVVTGTGFQQLFGATNDVVVNKLTLTGDGGVTRNLTTSGTAVEITSATSFSVTLAGADLAAVNSMFNKNGTTSTTPTTYNLAAAEDWNAGADPTTTTIVSPTNPVTVSNVLVPAITSATYDVSTGILVVTGTGFQQLNGATNDVVVNKLTLTGDGGATRNLSTSGTAVEITSATSFSVTLAGADLAAVNLMFNKNGTSSTTPTTYNLAAAEDWNAGADASTTTTVDPTNGVTVSNVAVPAITSATYDVSTGILVVTGTGFQQLNGATNDVVVNKLTLKGDGGATRNLTTSGTAVEITSATSFSVTLAGADLAAVNSMFNKNGTTSTTPTTYNLAAAEDWNAGADASTTTTVDPTNGVTVSNVAVPAITSATYDAGTGILVVTGTGFQQLFGATNDVVVNKLTLKGENGDTRNLTTSGTAVEITSATSFSVTLAGADLAAVNLMLNKNGTTSTSGTAYNLAAAEDWNAGADASTTTIVSSTNTVTVSNVAVPAISSATYNVTTGVLVVTGTGFLSKAGATNDIVVANLTLTGENGDTRNLTTSGTGVEVTSATSFSVTLGGADLAAVNLIFNKNGTASTSGTNYNLAAAEDWNAGADATTTTTVSPTNPVTVSNVAIPAITSATYDVSTGILVVTGTGFLPKAGTTNDIDVTKLSLTGEGSTRNLVTSGSGVEITSATSFSVTLTGADLAAVNLLFNKNGTSSTNTIAYNLAAAEDWNAGAEASVVIVDATSGVTVSGVAVPVITSVAYDASTGILTASGTNFLTASGSNNDINALKITFIGEGAAYTLTGGSADITDATSFAITLNPADKDGINLILNKNGTGSTSGTLYNMIASEDWNAGADATVIIVDAVSPVTVSNVAQPAITSAAYDATSGVLTVTGTGFLRLAGAGNDINLTNIVLRGEGNQTRPLTASMGGGVDVNSTTTFVVQLSVADMAVANTFMNKNGTAATGSAAFNLTALEDWNAGADASLTIADGTNQVTVTNALVPAITSASFAFTGTTGSLQLTGTGFLKLNGAANEIISDNKFTFTGEGGNTYTLTSATAAVEINNATSANILITGADVIALREILNANGTSSTGTTTYNLAAAEDWNAGADAAVNIVDPTTPLTVSGVPNPTITSATYDATTGVLAVTGTGMLSLTGSNNDIDVTKLSIESEGTGYILTGATTNVDIASPTSFTLTLGAMDKAAVTALLNKDGLTSTGNTTYNLRAADNWNTGAAAAAAIQDLTGNGINVSNVAVPTITSATYDATSGMLTVTGTSFFKLAGPTNEIDVTKLTFTGEGNATYALAHGTPNAEILSSTLFSVLLSATDRDGVNLMLNKAGTSSTGGTTYNLAAGEDWALGADAAITIADAANAITVSNIPTPAITSAAYDVVSGILTVTGTGFVHLAGAANDIDVLKFTITGEGGGTFLLTSNTANVDVLSTTQFAITLGTTDKASVDLLLNNNGTISTGLTTYDLGAAEDWITGAEATVNVADPSGNGITVSSVPVPTITSATYNAGTGTLTIIGTGLLAKSGMANDIDATKISFAGEGSSIFTLTSNTPDVEIVSATSFVLVLGATDRVGVNQIMNKNGLTSTDGTAFNLIGSEDWNRGADASVTIVDHAGNPVTVSSVAVPTITSATYDATSGVLTVTGTDFLKSSGASNDIDVTKITLTGEGSYQLTTAGAEITNATTFALTLNAADKAAVNVNMNKAGTSSTGAVTYNIAAAEDWNRGADGAVTIVDVMGNPVTVSNVPVPVITSAAYDLVSGVLTVTGTGFLKLTGAANDIDATKFTITGEGAGTFQLTSNTVNADILSGTAFTLTLGATDKASVDLLMTKNGTSSTGGTTYNLAAAEDWNTGAETSVTIVDLTLNGITVSGVPVPTIVSATYNATTGVVNVTGTGFLAKSGATNDIDATKFTFTGEGGSTIALTSNTSDVEITSPTSFALTLGATDKASVDTMINKNGTVSTNGTTYNIAAAEDWNRGADVSVTIADLAGNGVTVSNVAVPVITSATYNATTGVLVVTGTGFVRSDGPGTDIIVNKLTLTGEAAYPLTSNNVDITSGTSFSITLNATDKAAVNMLMNKNGTSSTSGVTYNLAASEDWSHGTDASVTIADLTSNPITVSSVAVPMITSAIYDPLTGILAVTGTDFLQLTGSNNDIDVSKLTLTGEGGGTYQLTTASVDLNNGTTFFVTLNPADKSGVNALLNKDGTTSSGGTTYNLAAAENWTSGAAAGVTDVDGTNAITVSGVPTITIVGTLSAVNTVYGSASATPATFTVGGTNMVAGIAVTPPAGFELSQTPGGASGYGGRGNPITVGTTGTIAATTVYVRLSDSTAFGTYSGNIVTTSTGALNKNIATVSSTVSTASLTVTANNVTRVYGTNLIGGSGSTAFTVTGLVNHDVISSVAIGYEAGGGNGNATGDPIGVYTGKVMPSFAIGTHFTATNYTINYVYGNITVTAAPLTIAAVNAIRTYGLTLTGGAGSAAFTPTGLVNAETISTVTIGYATGGGNGNTTTDPVGTYSGKITPSAPAGGSFTSGNYTITFVTGNIIVNPAPLAIAAGNGTKNFHTLGNLTGTAFTATGLQNSETVGSLSFTSVGAFVTTVVGNYPITPSGATGGTFNAGNYAINYTSGNLQVIPSVNPNLSSLVVSSGALTPAFAANTTNYSVSVSNLVTTITLTPTVDVPGTTVTVNGAAVVSGNSSLPVSLIIGNNPITVVTTAGDGVTKKTYMLNVVRAVSSDASLSALSLITGSLNPTFATGTLNYTATVSNATLTNIAIATAANISSTITVNGITVTSGSSSGVLSLVVGSGNLFNIVVKAADGVTSQTYKIAVNRLPNANSALTSLVVNTGTLSPVFSATELSYTMAVPFGTTSMTVTPAVAEVTATIAVNGITTTSGTASGSITLSTGANTINVVVTAQDGVTKSTYKLVVTRAAGNNAELSALRLSTGVLAPTFTPATLNYTATVPNGTTSITVTPTLSDVTSAVAVNGITVTSGSPSGTISLTVGTNTINIVATAVDGVSTRAYQVIVTRASGASTNTNLTSITMSTGTLSPVFTSTTTNYAVLIPETVNSLGLTVTAAEISAAIKVNGLTATSGVALTGIDVTSDITLLTISVTAADGVTTNAYTITVTKPRTSWTGNVSNAWNNTANWTNGVPGSTKSAVVTNANTLPVITGNENTNNLTINTGASITITGGLTVAGNAVNSGTISGTGIVTFSGTLAQTLSGTGTINNLTVNNTSQFSIAPGAGNTQSLTGILKITAGTMSTGNNLVLISTAAGTASVAAIPAGSTIVGQVTAQRWFTGQRGFRILGHPFNANLPLSQLTDNFAITGPGPGFTTGLGYSAPSVFSYDSVAILPLLFQKPLSVVPNAVATPVWTVGRGIMAMVRGKGNEGLSAYPTVNEPTAFAADVTGTLNQGTLGDYVLGANPLGTSFNLVGNPYAAPINIRSVKSNGGGLLSANNSASGVVNTIFVYNPTKSAGISSTPNQEMRGGWDAFTNDGNTDIIIPPFGAFFVQSKAAGNVVRFDESAKAVDKTPISVMGFGNTSKLTLQVENKRGAWDDIKLRWDNKAVSAGTDVYDGSKQHNELFDFYSISSDKLNLCIDSRSDSFNREEIIPLGINTQVQDATFRIKVSAYNMPANVRVFLRDKLLNTETPLEKVNDGYAFAITAEEASKGDNRFELAVNFAKQAGAPIVDVTQDNIRFMPNPFRDELIIQLGRSAVSATSTTKVRLVNMQGRVVKTATEAPGVSTIRMKAADLASGVYFVEVINDAGRITKQVIKE